MNRVFTFLCGILLAYSLNAQLAVQQWRDHFPNTGTIGLAHGNGRIYCANPYIVYSYNLADNSIEKYSKVNRLSDVGISAIAFDETTQTLVVGYDNGNLDLIRESGTTNIKSIQNSGLFGVKTINEIRIDGGRCYLSCGFGIVYFDLVEQEVIDSYIIGPGGATLQVYRTVEFQGEIFAATDIGLLKADASSQFLANFANWSKVLTVPFPNQTLRELEAFGDHLFIGKTVGQDGYTVWRSSDLENWEEQWSGEGLRAILNIGNNLAILAYNYLNLYNSNNNYLSTIASSSLGLRPSDALVINNGEIWLGDEKYGLIRHSIGSSVFETIQPEGPSHLDVYELNFEEGILLKTGGAPANNWSRIYNPRGFEVFKDGEWTTFDHTTNDFLQSSFIYDVVVTVVDPDDENHWYVGAWGDGLMEFQNGEVVNHFTEDNSPLEFAGQLQGAGVAGMKLDEEGYLWVTNGYSETPLLAYSPEGEWIVFAPDEVGAGGSNLYSQILIDQSGYKWCVRPRGHGLVVYNDNGTPEDLTDDEAVEITNQLGEGNLPTMDIYSIAEDLNGEVWVGTGEGIGVFYSAGSVFSGSNFDAQEILIEQDGNIQVLLETEQIRSIVIDGANRKWIATVNSGVYLLSEDGTEEVHHFTVDNSPLPSNSVLSMALDGETGEVFFGTEAGVVSYKSTATDGAASNECAKVYPNPARESYNGPIAITGLERNTDVKITDVAGNLVFQTTSEGGQAIWYGQNLSGDRVTTGVYTALCTAPEGNSKCVAKIMVVR